MIVKVSLTRLAYAASHQQPALSTARYFSKLARSNINALQNPRKTYPRLPSSTSKTPSTSWPSPRTLSTSTTSPPSPQSPPSAATAPSPTTNTQSSSTQPPSPPPTSPTSTSSSSPPPSYELTFTCKPCHHRSTHTITKQGYHHGAVLITCPSCKNRHVISDHLGIFADKKVTVEDLMRERGELVRRGTVGAEGDVEFWDEAGGDGEEGGGIGMNV